MDTYYLGDCLEVMDKLEADSIDAIITDPPYELNFMGKGWDNAGVSFRKETWEKCLRVLKPGGYLLAFGGSRTFHRIACAIEDAGFEIRDTIMWIYGSGFSKSMNVGKALESKLKNGSANKKDFKRLDGTKVPSGNWGISKMSAEHGFRPADYTADKHLRVDEVAYSSEIAKQWDGWGTCLKPAFEPIIVARKPFKGSLVDNILEHGVGGLNIDECRVGDEIIKGGTMPKVGSGKIGVCNFATIGANRVTRNSTIGRFPANIIHDGSDEATRDMPETKGSQGKGFKKGDYKSSAVNTTFSRGDCVPYNDSGSASRYFYCAKASRRDRDEGLDGFCEKIKDFDGISQVSSKDIKVVESRFTTSLRNIHPTVKPTALMQYLVRLVCPKGSVILDPFMGSGSTGKAIAYENKDRNAGYSFIGIEQDEQYVEIAKARIKYANGKEENESNHKN